MGNVLAYTAAGLVALWGIAHLVPTAEIVAGFGEISVDNRRVLLMEWVAEGLTMLFISVLVIAVTAVAGADDAVVVLVYRVGAGGLVVMGAWTALTGARTPVIWFKICPVILTATAALLVTAGLV
jgi:hypothetical protein